MDKPRWERIQEVFHRAVDLSVPVRERLLEDTCAGDPELAAEVRAMIEEESRDGGLLDRDVSQIAERMLNAPSFEEVGRYRVRGVLGEGGMGVVYLAERMDLGNLVALKILRDAWFSPARRKRFAAEQRTLARLNHPSIARLYDAGTLADGTPWFVLEYVDGLTLAEYCRRNSSSIEERLKLVRAVAEAVEYAHSHSIIHRDLKPSNILVKSDGSVRLLDFGIAKQLDVEIRPEDQTRTNLRPMTPAYAAPEQLRGDPAVPQTDVYSLGVILYELIAGHLPIDVSHKTAREAADLIVSVDPAKPSGQPDLDSLCLTAMHKDPTRRYESARALIRDIDHFLNRERLEARPESHFHAMARLVRRNARKTAAVLVVLALGAGLAVFKQNAGSFKHARTIAILPMENPGNDPSIDFLRFALADEISGTLGYARAVSIRATKAPQYSEPGLDIQKAGRELRVEDVISGRLLKAGDQLQITLAVTDTHSGSELWREVFDVPAAEMVAAQAQIAAKTRRGLAPALGISEFATERIPQPKNERAYQLYLRAKGSGLDMSLLMEHPEINRQAIELLDQSVALDPSYAPAWEALADRYAEVGWFGNGGEAALENWRVLSGRIARLDPDNVVYRAGVLYIGTAGGNQDEGMNRGRAYREIDALLRRRPDSARLHFIASWMLRDTGLLEESARECDTSVLIDAHDAGARSCGVTFMLRGDYPRAFDYLKLDPASDVARAVSIDVLLRQGKAAEALAVLQKQVPLWGGYATLAACLDRRPSADIAALAQGVKPAADPEVNYFSAAHLSYCGQPEAAGSLLRESIARGYCSYPAIDSDPLLANLRARPEFAEIRSAAKQCQTTFLAQRSKP
jgi:TolB-like protein/predicted Ser/Thr protein kinase